jgi:hypothetical protein
MRVRPVRTSALVAELAERIVALPAERPRVIVDGAPPTGPGALVEELAVALRVLGRAVLAVAAEDFLRPASVRLEWGRDDPDELLTGWLDEGGLRREVLDPAGPGGSGEVLPRLWDAAADRAFRADRVPLPSGGVVLLYGSLLLGRGLPADLTVHLHLSDAALARRLPDDLRWTLPAHHRYAREHTPRTQADLVVLADNPTHPAIVDDL